MEGRVQEIQQRYFGEYQLLLIVEGMQRELARWEAANATILDMSLQEQSTYADYVTRKICAEQPAEVVNYIASDMFATAPLGQHMNTCAIGNAALLVNTVMNDPTSGQDLKDRLFREHQLLLADQRRVRLNPRPPVNQGE